MEGRKIDFLTEPWEALEKACIKVLGGPFQVQVPEHQIVALGLAAVLGDRLGKEFGAFWFPMRESDEGAQLGFPEALIMLSPFGAVVDAFKKAKLAALDDVIREVRASLGQVKFGMGGGKPVRLGPEDYMRLFDPGFIQLVGLDETKAANTWGTAPDRLAHDLRDAISRAAKLPAEVKKQLDQQLAGSLARMEPGKPLREQMGRAPRVAELAGLLFGATHLTGAAGEEFWFDVVFPLLFVGAPATFPPLDDEELEAAKSGVDPLFLFLEVVPYQFKAPEEAGLLGAFPGDKLSLPDKGFEYTPRPRLIKVTTDAIAEPLKAFDPAKTRDVIRRFGEYLKEKSGVTPTQGAEEAKQMLDAGLSLLTNLKEMVNAGKVLCVRRLTEAEAASEPALAEVRAATSAPRIILTS